MIDHAKITICGNCEYSEQTRWGLLCRRLARQDAEGDVDDLYVSPLDFCCWGTPLVTIRAKGEGTE